ncbi:hypothetical protein BKA62DRAFT_732468 [Auriculariales sp. MPI-PUGE-AT-0066]|nr:hypothetical protein BKA62DRAFT_732468 [Auriculariales sp. MPI-PUGE-AT-0066]
MHHHRLWAFVLGAAVLARADFVDTMITLDESDKAVRCTVVTDCKGKAECIGAQPWNSLASKAYKGGKMFVTDNAQRAQCTVGFQGNMITMYGQRQKDGAQGEWSIDAGPSTAFSWATEKAGDKEGITSLFRVGGLDPHKNHTLIILVLPNTDPAAASAKAAQASVDFFVYTDPLAPTPSEKHPVDADKFNFKDKPPFTGGQGLDDDEGHAPVDEKVDVPPPPPKNDFAGGHHPHHDDDAHKPHRPSEHVAAEMGHNDASKSPPVDNLAHSPGQGRPAQDVSQPNDEEKKTLMQKYASYASSVLIFGGFSVLVLGFFLRRRIWRLLHGRRRSQSQQRRRAQDEEEVMEENEALLK